ncbi:C40 family peptidase [Pedobacter frigoris]|uniref:NlpC/P60 family protein n=1 Tax=Pedobacter frigoris TaxID=2571272 RepID=A0A4U1CSR3_9SPHI|nr:C40 family peptidase [Pedobacter frigoris]TKC08778.1 NlpC/P60 family protein [Pedobacter frigoris]
MELQYGICKVAVAQLRAEPSDRAEISTQLLFGDHVEIIEKTEKWWRIKNAYDGYEGWMDFKQLDNVQADVWDKLDNYKHLTPASLNNTVIGPDGSAYYLSPGSNLPLYQDGYCYLGDEKFKVEFNPGTVSPSTKEDLITTATFFQNVPYLWGGKNLYGIDCSGFMQIVFKLNGIKLKRDAWQQAEQGSVVDFLQEVEPGDVAFFDNDEGRITHVGMMLNATEIIHASGKVRIDKMDNQGIYNAELGRYTHKLRIIKRFA